MVEKYICIPHRFLIINVCNKGKNLCSACIFKSSIQRFSQKKFVRWLSVVFGVSTERSNIKESQNPSVRSTL
jgi:hypothetical protein